MKQKKIETQKRIDIIVEENEAIKRLNDMSEMKKRIQNEKPIHELLDLISDEKDKNE